MFMAANSSCSIQTLVVELLSSKGIPKASLVLQAAMKVAECRRELAAAAQTGREPVLASQTQTDSEIGEHGL